jgi:hypothetical protein
MEPFKMYLTTEGWQNDWQKTRESCSRRTKELSDYVVNGNGFSSCNKERGSAKSFVLLLALAPIGAYVGSYIGQGAGSLTGNVIDFLPYVRDIAPRLAERTGLVQQVHDISKLNVDLYRTIGAISGFWFGMMLPLAGLFGSSKKPDDRRTRHF